MKTYCSQNKEYLLKIIMKQLGITESDLYDNPSYFKTKVRDAKIEEVLKK